MQTKYTAKDIDRFWGKVQKDSILNGCWIWKGTKTKKGYGYLTIQGKTIGAHKFSYVIQYGAFSKNLYVLHKCDNPPCVNPFHLFLGTQKQNILDAMNKGRLAPAHGEKSGRHKLNNKQIDLIRQEYLSGNKTINQIAREYNVGSTTIFDVVHYKTWKR